MDLPSHFSQDCLCLLCRGIGHIVQNCPLYLQVEPTRPSPPFNPLVNDQRFAQSLCQRCSQLGAISSIESHHPIVWEDLEDEQHSERVTEKTRRIPSLGLVRSLQLLSTCPLCRLIFDMSYLTEKELEVDKGELVLVTGWSIHRLEPNLDWKGWEKGDGPYMKCVYTSVATLRSRDAGVHRPTLPVEDAVDAIGLIDTGESQRKGMPALRVREVDPKTLDYRISKDWLRRCDDLHHVTCRPLVSEDLKQIKLVNVETRQIVSYPIAGCDYIALSYVWGDVEQPSYKLGDVLPTVPATLEDAMVVTRNLGKQYLWVDSLCIDQENDEEKATQIASMSTIYSGAWATIISLSGESVESGLPRVGTLQGVVRQVSCEIGGKRILSVMPTLADQISWSSWSTRAWTYQEGLLSPRRLFFTNHQVYFECNSVQCCESLDESNSPFHHQTDEQRLVALDDVLQDPDRFINAGPESVVGRGILRDPFRPISSSAKAQVDVDSFARYLRLRCSYTMKETTHESDSLNAFAAVLTRLEEKHYKQGFLQGLPIDDFPRALLWFHSTTPRRRVGFPAWSWAGWKGEVSDIVVHGAETVKYKILPPMRIWKAGCNDHPELIYTFNPTSDITNPPENSQKEEHESQVSVRTGDSIMKAVENLDLGSQLVCEVGQEVDYPEGIEQNDPVLMLAETMLKGAQTALPRISGSELLVEGIVIQLSLTEYPDSCSVSETGEEDYELCFVRLKGDPNPQRIMFYGHNARQLANQRDNSQLEFLLVSREPHMSLRGAQKMYNALLLINLDGDVANKVGVASLRLDNVELLNGCKPERKLFKLR